MKKQSYLVSLVAIAAASATAFAQNTISPKAIGTSDAQDMLKGSGMMFTQNKGQIADAKGNLCPDILYKGDGDEDDLVDTAFKSTIINKLNSLPPIFKKNMGQWDALTKKGESKILYSTSSHGRATNAYFMKDKVSFGLIKEDEEVALATGNFTSARSEKYKILVWALHFIGANPNVKVYDYGLEKSTTNYLIGNDPSKYVVGAPECKIIKYENIYKNIDLRYYTSGENIKYDYIIGSGGNISQIKMGCEGIKKLRINKQHQLEITHLWGTMTEEIPESYQFINGEKRMVKIQYVLKNDTTFSFKVVGRYDRNYPLIIDPVILKWSTWVGGTNTGYLFDIAKDAAGYIYGTGWYFSTFPVTAGSYDLSFNGGTLQPGGDAFVFKMKSDATGPLVYATYIGGSSDDYGNRLCVDNTGNVYVTGCTKSSNFPSTAGCVDNTYNGSADVFVTKLNSTGTALLYSTYLGGTDFDEGNGIAVNTAGEVFVTGEAFSYGTTAATEFPTTPGAYDRLRFGTNAFVSRLNATGSALIYSTFIGGYYSDYGNSISINSSNVAYITGAASAGFPTTAGCVDATFNDAFANGIDVFFSVVNANGSNLMYSTYLGGTAVDKGSDIAIGTTGDAFITGYTKSSNFPVKSGGYSTVYSGTENAILGGDAFVSHIQPGGMGATDLLYSTFIGGGGDDVGAGIVVNTKGEAYIAGYTFRNNNPNNFPVTTCSYRNSFTVQGDHFVCKLSTNGSSLMYSTVIGGEWADYNHLFMGIELIEGCGDEIIVGATSHSPNYPTTPGVFQPVKLNASSVIWDQPIVFKFSPEINPGFLAPLNPLCNFPLAFTDTTNQCGLFEPLKNWLWDFGDGTTSNLKNPTHTYNAPGMYQVKLVLSCPKDSVTKSITVTGTCASGPSVISTGNSICSGACATVTSSATGGSGAYTYSWSTGATTQNINPCPPVTTTYTVTVTDSGGNAATSTAVVTVNKITAQYTKGTANCSNCGCKEWIMVTGINGTPPYIYQWSDGHDKRYKNALCPGVYNVMVTDNNGCKTTVKVNAP